jgi:hypothetical protein
MTKNERLHVWFNDHRDALPQGWAADAIGIRCGFAGVYVDLEWDQIDEPIELALQAALLRWMGEWMHHAPCLTTLSPGTTSNEWTVAYGTDGEETHDPDLLAALLDAAEAMEEDE